MSIVLDEARAYAEGRDYDRCQIIEGAYTVGDAITEAYCAGRTAKPTEAEVEAVAKRLMWSDECPRWRKTHGTSPDEGFFWERAGTVGTRDGYLAFAKELLETARRTVGEGLL